MRRTILFWSLVLALFILLVPQAEATVGTMYNGSGNLYDVNRDGNITASDVTEIYNYILGYDAHDTYNYDQNGDGEVTSYDITLLYNALLNGTYYNSIFDAFNLSFTNYLNRDYYKFSWDDVTTLGYGVKPQPQSASKPSRSG